jgi:hypothetical protein
MTDETKPKTIKEVRDGLTKQAEDNEAANDAAYQKQQEDTAKAFAPKTDTKE